MDAMNVYSVKDVSTHLNLKPTTLRKYCGMLEKSGYSFDGNSQGHRFFRDKDVIAIRTIIQAKHNGITLEEAIDGVVYQAQYKTETNETSLTEQRNITATDSKESIEELKLLILNQNELILSLNKRLESIEEKYNENQQHLIEVINKESYQKKSLISRLFTKKKT